MLMTGMMSSLVWRESSSKNPVGIRKPWETMELLLVFLSGILLYTVGRNLLLGLCESRWRGPWSTQTRDMEVYARHWNFTNEIIGGDKGW